MAMEEEVQVSVAEPPKKKAGSKVALLAIISLLLLALLGVGGFMLYKMLGAPSAGVEGAAPEGGAPATTRGVKLGEIVPLEPFIVNLAGESGKRYLKVTMQVELSNMELSTEVSNKMPQIKDSVITVLSSKTTEELLSVEGKFKLKEQILTRINNLLTTGVVKNVYFVEFVIQ